MIFALLFIVLVGARGIRYRIDSHYNSTGHGLIAGALLDELERTG